MSGISSVSIHTDGSTRGASGEGGWAAVFESEEARRIIFGFGPSVTTINEMEIRAIYEALRHSMTDVRHINIFTDSKVAWGWASGQYSPRAYPYAERYTGLIRAEMALRPSCQIGFHWIPTKSTEQNRLADERAKAGRDTAEAMRPMSLQTRDFLADALVNVDDRWLLTLSEAKRALRKATGRSQLKLLGEPLLTLIPGVLVEALEGAGMERLRFPLEKLIREHHPERPLSEVEY